MAREPDQPGPAPTRVELTAPDGAAWAFGPPEARNLVTGAASDWCRLVARRDRDGVAQRLKLSGPDASNILEVASAF